MEHNIVLQNSLEVCSQSARKCWLFLLASSHLPVWVCPRNHSQTVARAGLSAFRSFLWLSGSFSLQTRESRSCAHLILLEYQHTQAHKQCASSPGNENQWGFEKTHSLKSWPYLGTCKKLGCHRRIFWLCYSFLLYGSSMRNLLGLCSDSLQVLCVFFTPSQEYLLEEKPICWSKEAKDPIWPLLSKVFLSKLTCFYHNYFSIPFLFLTTHLLSVAFCLCKCGIV